LKVDKKDFIANKSPDVQGNLIPQGELKALISKSVGTNLLPSKEI